MSAMEEWQRRMKAEKEAERQKKNESADMLKGYRGMGEDEEAKKLKAAREEEKRKKEEAQNALRVYKGNDMEDIKKLKAQKEEEMKKKLDAQMMLHEYKSKDVMDAKKKDNSHFTHQTNIPTPVNAGGSSGNDGLNQEDIALTVSVSERAALISSMAATTILPPTTVDYNNNNNLNNTNSNNNNNQEVEMMNGDINHDDIDATIYTTLNGNANAIQTSEGTVSKDEIVVTTEIESETDTTTAETPIMTSNQSDADNNENPNTTKTEKIDAPIVVVSSTIDNKSMRIVDDDTGSNNILESKGDEDGVIPSSVNATDSTTIEPTPSPTIDSVIEDVSQINTISSSPSPPLVPVAVSSLTSMHANTTIIKQQPEPLLLPEERLDVLFSFGLVTVQTDPVLDPYMNAVEEVVIQAIAENPMILSKVFYHPESKPYVRSTLWDSNFKSKSGRADVRRLVVTASVPVFLNHNSTTNDTTSSSSISRTRESVVEALTAAIQTGSFLAIARRK